MVQGVGHINQFGIGAGFAPGIDSDADRAIESAVRGACRVGHGNIDGVVKPIDKRFADQSAGCGGWGALCRVVG